MGRRKMNKSRDNRSKGSIGDGERGGEVNGEMKGGIERKR